MDLDDLIATAQFQTAEVRVCFRGDLVHRHADLRAELKVEAEKPASLAGNPEAKRLAAEIVAVEDLQADSSKTFKLTAIGSRKWANLLMKHPPSKEERRQGQDHDPNTFPPAAFAACSLEPDVSPKQAQEIFELLPAGEWNKIWITLIDLNVVGVPSPKLLAATELLQASEQSSTTSDLEESPEARSLAGSGEPSPPTTTDTGDDSTES